MILLRDTAEGGRENTVSPAFRRSRNELQGEQQVIRIVCLERDTIKAPLREPSHRCEWVDYPMTAAGDVVARLKDAQIAVVNKSRLDRQTIEALPQLRMIAECATGADNIDLDACRERDIVVSNVQGYAVNAVPEHTMMLMLALRRRLLDYIKDVRAGEWARADSFYLSTYPIGDLHGAVLGIVGRGALGQRVAGLAQAFGMKVMFAEHKGAAEVREGYIAFEQVLKEADIVSLHCPLTAETRQMIGREELALMKTSAVLVNTARGALIDEPALAEALRQRRIAGAAVDVLSAEPPPADNPLLAQLPNLIVTPHVAWFSDGAMRNLADQVIDNIDAFLDGRPRNRLA